MPSEAQEPRDRGPPPPVTRAGRSAHLAKVKASSPALERRPRGRPRKDGSHGRSAKPTPSPPLPPPPSLSKSRKKGRSRGQSQVDDKESTDTAKKSRPQKTEPRGSAGISTEPKEPKAQREVKAAGRRCSASRRKSHTNPDPEPNQYRFSPHSASHPDLAVPSHGPEPLPCSEEENRTRTCPAALPTDPAPDLRPDPDPLEEDQPSTIHISAPTVAEGGGASPMGPSPVTSPISSPSVSPCVRLEDEDSLSPLFQRSLSEDSVGSPTPSLDLSKKRLKRCAFCYRGDQPPLGQGRLLVFGPTPGYIPLHILNRRTSSDGDDDCHEHCYRGNRDPPTSSSLEPRVSFLCGPSAGDQSSSEFIKQLGPIGLPHDVNVQSLFDATGQCCAHLHCASWSEGVLQGEGQSLLYVDRAIDSGSTQVCAFCKRLGASLRCQMTGCGRSYHFPCAAAAGAQQDWSQRLTLCTRHAHTDSSQCVACSDGAGPDRLLMCCCCGNCYHGSCLVPPLSPSPLRRAGWQCPECQVCRRCRLREDDAELLVCERCDKAYHTHCLTPPVDHRLSSGWTCRNCRVCRRCGVMSSGQWANHLFLCESCDPAPPCLLCGHAPDFSTPHEVLTCTCCHRLAHAECSVQSGEGRTGSEGYTCSSCRPQGTEQTLSISHTSAPPDNISLSQVPPHSETPPISAAAHSPVQLISSEPSQTEPSELQHSPKPSPDRNQRSRQAEEKQDSPSIEDLPIRLRQPTTVLKVPLARSLKGLEGSPSPSSLELQRSLSSSSKENNHCCSPSPDDTRTNTSLVPTKHKHSPVRTPEAICQSPASSTEEQQQSPTSSTEQRQSPASSTEQRQNPNPSTEKQRQSPASSTEEQRQSPASSVEQRQSPASSTEEQWQSPIPSMEEKRQSPAPSTEEQCQSPTPSAEEQRQSPTPSAEEQRQSPTPSAEEQCQSLASSTEEQCQSPTPSAEEQRQSPAPSSEEQRQSPVPSTEEQRQNPTPSTEEKHQSSAFSTEQQRQSPASTTEEQRQIPAPSTEEQHQRSASSTEEQHQSPAPSTGEHHQSPAPSTEEHHQSPAPSTEEQRHIPDASSEKQRQSPAPSTEEQRQSPSPSTEEKCQIPAPSTEEQHQSSAFSTEEQCQNPAPSTGEEYQSPAPSTKEKGQSPAPSTKEEGQSPAPSTGDQCQCPAPSTGEQRQSPSPSIEEQHQSLAPSSEEQRQSSAPSTEEQCQNPALSTWEEYQSPAPSTKEKRQSPAPSTGDQCQCPSPSSEEQHQSPAPSSEKQRLIPAPSSEEQHPSPALSSEEQHQSPAPSTGEQCLIPAPSTEEQHQSPSPSTEEQHQSPAPSTEEQHKSPAPSSEEQHQSPSPSTEEQHQSPAPSTEEQHQSPEPSTEEQHQSPAPSTEEQHQSHAPSSEEQHQIPASSTDEQRQSPSPSTEEQHQSPAPSSEEQHQSPAPSTEEQHQIPAPSTKKRRQSPAPSTEEQHQSPSLSTEKRHQSPAPTTEEQHQSPAPTTEEQHQSPAPTTVEQHQNPAASAEEHHQSSSPSTEEQHQSPASSTEEQHQSPAPSMQEQCQCSTPSAEEQHQRPSLSTEKRHQSLSTELRHQSPAPTTEEQDPSLAPTTEEQHQSPAPTTVEQRQNPAPSTEEHHQSPAPSKEEHRQSPASSMEEQHQSPTPSMQEQCQCPTPSTEVQLQSQSPTPSTEEICQRPTPSEEDQCQSPVPSIEMQHQSPTPSMVWQCLSPASSLEAQRQSPVPSTKEQHQSPLEEECLSPVPSKEVLLQSPAPLMEEQYRSPAPLVEEQHQSPAPSTEEQHQSPAPSMEEQSQSLAPFEEEPLRRSAPFEEEPLQSLAHLTEEQQHESPALYTNEQCQSPAASSEEPHESPAPSIKKFHQMYASSPHETHPSALLVLKIHKHTPPCSPKSTSKFPGLSVEGHRQSPIWVETQLNLEDSLEKTQQCLPSSPKGTHGNLEALLQETLQTTALSLKEMHQSPNTSPKDIHQSRASFSKESHQPFLCPLSSLNDIYQSPVLSPKDVHPCRASSPKVLHHCPTLSLKDIHQSLTLPPKDNREDLAPSIKAIQHTSPSSPKEVHQIPTSSPKETYMDSSVCQSQEVPVSFPEVTHHCQAPSSGETHESINELQEVLAPLSVEHYQSPTQSPSESHIQQSLTFSLVETCQSSFPALSTMCLHSQTQSNPQQTLEIFSGELCQISEPCLEDIQQTPELCSEHAPQSPIPSPKYTHQSAIPSPKHAHQSPAPSLEDRLQSFPQSGSSPKDTFQSPALSPKRTCQSPVLSLEVIHPSLGPCHEELKRKPTNPGEIPPLALKEIHQSTLVSLAEPPGFQESTIHSSPSPTQLQDRSSLPHSGQTELGSGSFLQEYPSSSHLDPSQDQERNTLSHLCQGSSTLSQPCPPKPKLGQGASLCLAEQHQSLMVCAQDQQSFCLLNFTSSSPAQNPSEHQQRPIQTAHSPLPQSLTELGLSPTRVQPGPAESKNSPKHKTRLSRSWSPTSPPQSPTQKAIGLDPFDPEPLQSCSKSSSTPCSPNPPPFRTRLCSLIQPSSPEQLQCDQAVGPSETTTEPSSQSNGQTLGSSSDLPQTRTSESLDHSNLTGLPCTQETKVDQSPCGSPLPCPGTIEAAGDSSTQPAAGLSPTPIETSSPTQSTSRGTVTQPEPLSCQVHPDSLVHTEAVSSSGSSLTQISSAHIQSFCRPPSSPSHGPLTNSGPADAFGTKSLNQMSPCCVSLLRSSLAGQASPVQTTSPSTCVSPPDTPETQNQPPVPTHTTTSTGLSGTQGSSELDLDVVLVASPIAQEPDSLSAVGPTTAGSTSDGSLSPSHRRPETSPVSLIPSSPKPGSMLTSNSSPLSSAHSQVSPPHKTCTSSSVNSPVPLRPILLQHSPGPASPVQPVSQPDLDAVGPVQPKPNIDPDPVNPVQQKHSPNPVNPTQFEPSPDLVSQPQTVPGLLSPIQPDPGFGLGQQIGPVVESGAPGDVGPSKKPGRSKEEEEAPVGPGDEEERAQAEKEQAQAEGEEDQLHTVSVCSPSGVQQLGVIPLLLSASLTLQPSPHHCPSPTPPLHAISSEDPPVFSPHKMASPSYSPQATPPTEGHPQKREEVGLKESQSQSLIELVTVSTEPTKDEHQTHDEPSEKLEEVAEQQPMRERQEVEEEIQSEVEEEPPVSPVLDLDPSLDEEVMELMSSAAVPSLLHLSSPILHLSSRRGKGQSFRPPPCSSRPSDDLSIRLRQSPFSTEASPETSPARTPITPPPLTPPSPPLSRESPPLSQAPPTTVYPLTPKIGMGKPAISKRKFSPGRARVRQGSWWSSRRALSPPSSSQDSMGEGGWDSPKPRPPDSPLWSMKVGRGSGFPGRRRSRGGGIGGGRGGRGRSRLKTQDSLTVVPGGGYVEVFQSKEEEENSMHNTVVMFSTSDHFTLKQDMCVVCGSFGQGAEGRLLACSQCGQCYHPYCVNVKVTRVVLTKGWRCLECTVCEACGDASDPGRLLLCDDCDISYHTYCLDPPLHTVPKGAWKCQWCVWCVQCGSASPGLRCDWQSNYSLCGPCCSLSQCPICLRHYAQDDLILQCQQCDRWVHAVCQGLTSEEEVELAADEGFDCSLCRTYGRTSYGMSEGVVPYMAQIMSRNREPDSKTFTQDGVCLTESGLTQLQALVEPLISPRRYRRCKPKLKLRIINQNCVSVLQTPPDPEMPTESDQNQGDLDCDMKSDSSPEQDSSHLDDIIKDTEVTDCNIKKKRKPYRPGIGGFMVRQRGGKASLIRKDSTEMLLSRDPGVLDAEVSMETVSAAEQVIEKVKKTYRKKKTKLEEAFPSYLQEAFFGRDLLDRSRHQDGKAGPEMPGCNQLASGDLKVNAHRLHGPSLYEQTVGAMATNRKQGALPVSEETLVDLSDVLNTDPHILSMGHTGEFQVERSPSPFAGMDIGSLSSEPAEGCGRGQRTTQEEPMDAILSPELDKMVTDGAILSRLYKIPELEGRDVEEVFTAVLSPNSSSNQLDLRKTHSSAAAFPHLHLMNGLMPAVSHLPNTPKASGAVPDPAGFRVLVPQSSAHCSVSANQVSAASESEQDALSTAQKSMLKWEKEESLGELATVAPVLYCNTNFPQLRQQYPDWPTRVKQITKLWRKASSQDRAPYVQKARENRAAQRINKVQLSSDPLKHLQPAQPQLQPQPQLQLPPQQPQPQLQLPPQQPIPYDHVSLETDMSLKDPLRPRESEQEQEWKLRQQMRQKSKQLAKLEATQKLEQVKNEQRQQQLRLSGQLSPEAAAHQPVDGGNASPQQQPLSRQHLLQQGASESATDVFLRPQVPPPSGVSSLPSSPLHQLPSSPLMFSPSSSRPSSPWDSYVKGAGTPQSSSHSGGAPAHQQQRLTSLSTSPAHDAVGSPTPSPDSKICNSSQSGVPQSLTGKMSPSSGSAPDLSGRYVSLRAAEVYQRMNQRVVVPGSPGRGSEFIQGGVFKAPMPPLQEAGGARREPSRPTDLGFSLPSVLDPTFPSSPLSGLGSPHCSPYTQTPGTPRPDYSQQDVLSQQSPLSSRPSPDHYSNPQTPGTPHPHSDSAYLTTPPPPKPDQFTQQPGNRHLSPSHLPPDPYTSNPGMARPSERFPHSPGTQWCADPYAPPSGMTRPSPDLYLQQPSAPWPQKPPGDGFTTQPAVSGSSPLTPGPSAEAGTFTLTLPQRSPGPRQQDPFTRTSSSQTPKHPGISEASFSLHSEDGGHMTPGLSQLDKTAANGPSAVGVSPLDGPMSMMPQLGDSEEKLRQRQWLRQRILRQQHQKGALRQEKDLQDLVSGPAPPHSWLPEDSPTSSAAPADLFGRPPPPYPGTVRPPGPRFPGGFSGEQQRDFTPEKPSISAQSLPQNPGLRRPAMRFGGPPGTRAGVQDFFLRPPQISLPAPGLSPVERNPVQMRRSMVSEFTKIRPVMPPNSSAHLMPGVPQPFLPRSHSVQQHIMPFIELRHRAPENRLRLPFPLPDPEVPPMHPRDPVQPGAVRSGPARMGETAMAQQDQQHLGHLVLTQSSEVHHDGMEEHLEGEDSAVKDLEDVEVKDLVDLNLNLDPEDGKEDLDLGPNDLHLDDFLLSGKFDLIAYADPELNLEDKKDMFNEELDLGEPLEDREGGEACRKPDGDAHQVKQKVKGTADSSAPPPVALSRPPEAAGSMVLLSKEKLEVSGSVVGAGPAIPVQDQALSLDVTPRVHPFMSAGQQAIFQQNQRPLRPGPNPQSQSPAPQGPHALSPQPRLPLNLQNQTQMKGRHLLLVEQPLLIQDLLDKERQEQQQQKHMQAMIRPTPGSESGFSSMNFDSISDPIMKAKMVALKGINKVMSQGNLGLNPVAINRFQQAPVSLGTEGIPQPPHLIRQDGKLNPQLVRRNPPSFGSGFVNESQRRQYEEWLGETQQLLQMQQRLLEDQIAAHRKAKKALSAKQRTAKRAGRTLAEEDATQLRYISEQQGSVQKQLEQIRKQQKDHTELIEDYKNKNQQRLLQIPPQNLLTQPTVPLQPHPNGPTPVCAPSIPAGWSPSPGAPGPMGQRIPAHLPPQIPPTLPNISQGPQQTQNPPSIVPGLTASTPGFTTGPRVPSGGPNGAKEDGAALTPQVKFDDNNPFSEGFQERERRERLREQQERQRVQLMQEVERHRVLQQRLELEQQNLRPVSGAGDMSGPRVQQIPVPGAQGPGGLVRASLRVDGLSRMPFSSSDSAMNFLRSSTASRPSPQAQVQAPAGGSFPSQASLRQGFTGGPLHPAPGLLPRDGSVSPLQSRPRLPAQVHPGAAGMTPSHPGGQGPQLGHNSSSSSPSTPQPTSFPCSSGGSASTMHPYADMTADDIPKKKSRRGDGDDAGAEGAQRPLSPHSDITAPPTPAVSDTSCSTPTHQSDSSFSGLAPSAELERQLSARGSVLVSVGQRGSLPTVQLEVKEERMEVGPCGGGVMKMEEARGYRLSSPSSPLQGGEGGKELLRHLLKEKTSPANIPSPTRQTPPTAYRQLSIDSVRSEKDEGTGRHGNTVTMRDSPGPDQKKIQRSKRSNRNDKALPKYKRRKKEEEEDEKSLHYSIDPLMTHLRQLSVLPLMEPVLGVDLSLFTPYGSSSLGKDSRLSGSFGNASLDKVSDYYSQLIYKQNNLSNPPTPPASLPPTPPPVARQKLLNGFATTEELTRKEISEQEGVSALKQKEVELLSLSHSSKTVHVPASLPTPPHNNQEELRVQNSSDHDSLDGFVLSSSPESVEDMVVSRYPDLSFIKTEPPSPCPSPTFPIIPCAWGKGSAVKHEVKAEPHLQDHPSCSNKDLVTITITLNPVAAQNVPGVMATMAGLLRVPGPISYQLSRAPGSEQNSLALLAGIRVPLVHGPGPGRLQNAHPAVRNQPRCCSRCKGLLGNGVHLKQEPESRTGSSLLFCSPNCSALYQSENQNSSTGSKPAVPDVLTRSEPTPPSRTQHRYTNNMSSIAVQSLPHTPSFSSSSSPPLTFPPASAITMETRPRMDSLKVKVKLKPRPRAVPGTDGSPLSRHGKRTKSSRWRRWSVGIKLSRGPCVPNEAVAVPTEEEVDKLLRKLGACLRPDPLPKDQRRCCFCHQQGDGLTDGPARLLNLDLDLWVHLNCALWSSEVYETQAGALINVELALRRGLMLRCVHCQQTGATAGCNRLRCTNTYHFTCALQAHCTFFKDKTMLCHLHKPRTLLLSGDRSSSCSPSTTLDPILDSAPFCDPYDSELRCFAVFRRVFVQRDEARQIAAVVQRSERQHTFRVGSLLFCAVGRLLPQQMGSFHNQAAIFPIGYHANRYYWSMRHCNRRCKYMCYIEETEAQPLFKVKVVEKGHEDLVLTGDTPKAVWDQVLDPVAQLRSSSGTLKLFPVYLKGEDLFGLTTSAVTRIIESLPGVEACERYTFRYGRNPLMEWPLAFNPSGSARSEPKACQAKRPYLLTSTASRCQGSVGSIVGLVPGVLSLSPGETVAGAHQGRHSKSSQYRRMKAEWKTNVYLARSRIQGLGLYAARDIEKCTMVIEYIGAIIRSEVANRKERLYESQNRGVYMFRIDNDFVIDATITGGPARYINHSCSPNCITEVVTVEKENKIIISSCRRIQRGEELCYDYKFDLEDDQHKIPCHCGAMNCRKWMN